MRTIVLLCVFACAAFGQYIVSPPGEVITDPAQFQVPNINTFPTFGGGPWPSFQAPPVILGNTPPLMQWDVQNDVLRFNLYWDVQKMDAIGIPSVMANPNFADPHIFHPNQGTSHFFLLIDFGNMFPATIPAFLGGFPIGPYMGQPNPIAELRIGNAPTGPFCPLNWTTAQGFPICLGPLYSDAQHTINVFNYPPGFVQWASMIDMAIQFAACIPNGQGEWAFLLTWPQVI